MSSPVIRLKEVKKLYPMEGEIIAALRGVNFEVFKGEFVAVMGPSGSGKSTMMHILGLLDSLSEGTYELDGQNVSSITRAERAAIRSRKIGFVFQSFNLLSRSTALANVALPMIYQRPPNKDKNQKALDALKMVGLENRAYHLPKQLSGGQQQRVAIARALVNDPSIILADEPTGNLDTKTGVEIMNLITSLHEKGITIILVTHDTDVGNIAKRRIVVRDGVIVQDEKDKKE